MQGSAVRETFEVWIRSTGGHLDRSKAGGDYDNAATQSHWVSWQACWHAVTQQLIAEDRCWLKRDLLERIRNALAHYANPRSYEAPRLGGLLKGYPRGPKPTPQQMAFSAALLLRELDHPDEP